MIASGRELEADDFPHGTVDGWDAGCRGNWCPAEEQSCAQAQRRFVREWGYRKQVLAQRAARAAEARRRRSFTAEDKRILIAMAAAGRNNADIGRVLGFTAGAVGTRRRALHLPSVRRGRPRKSESVT